MATHAGARSRACLAAARIALTLFALTLLLSAALKALAPSPAVRAIAWTGLGEAARLAIVAASIMAEAVPPLARQRDGI